MAAPAWAVAVVLQRCLPRRYVGTTRNAENALEMLRRARYLECRKGMFGMAAWHRNWRTDLGLRGVGLILCGSAYLAIARLMALPLALHGGKATGFGLAAYGCAMVGFLGASAGGILTLCGAHIFDEIRVSARWRVRSVPHGRG